MRSIACALSVFLLLATSCASPPASTEAMVAGTPAPDLAQLREATIAGIEERPVQLSAGVWEGEPYVEGAASRPRVQLVEGLITEGDIDGDGADEAVVLLAASRGGSGVEVHVAAFGRGDAGAVQRGLATLGDRVQVRSVAVVQGSLEIEAILTGPQDAACCPTRRTRIAFALEDDGLRELGRVDHGAISAADLDGSSWQLSEFNPGEPAVSDSAPTLTFDGGNASGSTGCNNFRGAYAGLEKTGQALQLGPLASTERACLGAGLMEQESRFLRALTGAYQFRFVAGNLMLSYKLKDGATGMLVFVPAA